MNFRLGINSRLLLLGILPAGLISLTLAGYFVHTRFNDLETALTERGDLLVRQLATASIPGVFFKDEQVLQNMANQTLRENDVVEVKIFHKDGTLLANARYQPGNTETNLAQTSSGTLTFKASVVRNQTAFQGAVHLTLSQQSTLHSQWLILRNSLLITLSGLVGTGILAYRMGRRVSEPIHSLTKSALAISHGHLDTRAAFHARDPEFNALKSGFNLMAIRLQKSQRNLENKILHATKRLKNSLTSLEQQNAELAKGRQHAEHQNKIKSQFLAHISHEIRTPMNGIIGFTELLNKSTLTEEQRSMLQLIDTSAKNLLSIINDVLDLSTLEAGTLNLKTQEFRLRPHMEDAVALLVPKYTRVRLMLLIDSDVPDTINGDPLRIQQVVINLLGNAVKFTRHGHVIIRARVRQYKQQQLLMFSVSDTGCGISDKNRKKLFSPFHQLNDFAIDHIKGTGLGLAISKNIVERMHGKIGVFSRSGQGSTFWFTIPLTAQAEARDALPQSDLTIALTDDSPLSRRAFQLQLKAAGVTVHSYNSLAACMNTERTEEPAAHISILVLSPDEPDAEAIEKWCAMATLRESIPVIITTNNRPTRTENYYKALGAHTILNQPFRSQFLMKTLQTIAEADIAQEPTHPLQTDETKPSFEVSTETITETDLSNTTLLVADDNEINRILLKSQLSKTGAIVMEAKDGKEALELVRAVSFDLIFLDLQMPIMNGIDIVRNLKANENVNRKTPIIAVTAHALPEQKASVLKAGFADCLIKPIFQDQLLAIIDRWLPHLKQPENAYITDASPAGRYLDDMLEQTNGNKELACSILNKLFAELPEQLQKIRLALAHSELESAQAITHQLHGSAGFCRVKNVKTAAEKLESMLKQSDPANLNQLFEELETETNQFLALREDIMDSLSVMT